MAVKLEIIGKESIKPAKPTPETLRTLHLSFLDHSFPPIYIATIFFYNTQNHENSEENSISLRLKQSLSETLSRFYPLAGRIHGAYVSCNDEGAVFTEARADCSLSEFLRNPNPDSLEQVVPSEFITCGEPPETWPLLHVRATFFRSGGLAIAVCVSHKVCDGASFSTFLRGWTATAKGHADEVIPEFTSFTIFPPADPSLGSLSTIDEHLCVPRTCATKRFVFDASKIAGLKRKAVSEEVPNPTRVEAVTALIWRCATKASRSNSSTIRPSAMTQTMDLRRRSRSTYLTKNTIGNLLTSFVMKEGQESHMEIREIIAKMRRTTDELSLEVKESLQGDETKTLFGEKMANLMVKFWSDLNAEMDLYTTTSWCRMGFYEANFGWGDPVWVTPGSHTLYKNAVYVLLMDTKDGEGIEAWVSLPEPDMPVFEHDHDLLAFASPNLTVSI